MNTSGPVLLGGYASKQCPRRVHNDFDATIDKAPWQPPAELQARFDAGNEFEARVFDLLQDRLGEQCLRLEEKLRKDDRIEATVLAMTAGVPVVLNGQLPDDPVGGRVGKPDVLIRWDSGSAPAYLPADVKHHRTSRTVKSKELRASGIGSPDQIVTVVGLAAQVSSRFDDFVQLAHYTRMLQACGFHPGAERVWGAIVGTDDLSDVDPSGLAFVWHDLAAPVFKTFSRTAGTKKRSALERYDHEHGFRIDVARTATRRTGHADDPAPLVVPIWQQECELCPWNEYCSNLLGSDAASVAITSGRLDVREWLALDDAGVSTTVALADLEPGSPEFQATYLPKVAHRKDAIKRLQAAVDRAQMIRDGIQLRRITTGPLTVPRADVEIDLDIEWGTDERVYLWGTRLRHADTVGYRPFVKWDLLDETAEQELADELVAWLRGVISDTRDRGESVAIFHYTSPEPVRLRKVLGEDAVADLLPLFVDLHTFMYDHFVGVHGLGIKKVAPAFGFDWRDDDPGGLQSQGWLTDARSGDDESSVMAARRRLLRYNEDDVAATAAIRDGLRVMADS